MPNISSVSTQEKEPEPASEQNVQEITNSITARYVSHI